MKAKSLGSLFAPHILEFIHLKRSLGYKYQEEERILFSFDRFILDHDHTWAGLTKELADKWAEKRYNESDLTNYARIMVVRQFADHLRSCGIHTYIPKLPPYPQSTFVPYIYTYEEISAIFNACDGLRMKCRNVACGLFIMPCLLRLLYGTGMRIGEALSLKNKDVDTEGRSLILTDTKNGKERMVPISTSLALVCKDYLEHRKKLPVTGLCQENRPFFVSLNGGCCKRDAVYSWFRKVLLKAGIPFTGNRKGPRIHDIRHTFACHSFVKLADEGVDLYCSWPYLSTYLGHQSLQATEQYIRLTAQMYPELLNQTQGIQVDILPTTAFKTT
jgi:integrase/recombinase XerD